MSSTVKIDARPVNLPGDGRPVLGATEQPTKNPAAYGLNSGLHQRCGANIAGCSSCE